MEQKEIEIRFGVSKDDIEDYEEDSASRLMKTYGISEAEAKSLVFNPGLLLKALMERKEKTSFLFHHDNDKKKILYIHGLGGDQESRTGRIMEEMLPEYDILRPSLPESQPLMEYHFIKALIDFYHPVLVVGSSMGGFFTLLQNDVTRLIVNPVMSPLEDILNSKMLIDTPKEKTKTKSGLPFYVGKPYLTQIDNLKNLMNGKDVIGIFGNDPTGFFDHYEDFKALYPDNEATHIEASHILTDDQIKEHVIPAIRKILN